MTRLPKLTARASVRGVRRVGSLVALCTSLLAVPGVQAQLQPGFEDTIGQRMQACTACHGLQGRAGPDGYYPRLAGKPAGYLYHQLKNFQEGRRHYGLMADLLEPLSDAYLKEIAEYFANLDAPYSPPARTPTDPEVLKRGEQLVRMGKPQNGVPACASCHGPQLMGIAPNSPGLLGLPKAYLTAQLGAWRAQQRQALAPDCMAAVVRSLSDEDLNAAASWLAAQPVPAGAKPAAAPKPVPTGKPRCGSAPELTP